MAKKTGKNRQCPYRAHCSNECYGDNPCDFAVKFDRMQKKITRLTEDKAALEKQNANLKEQLNTLMNPGF